MMRNVIVYIVLFAALGLLCAGICYVFACVNIIKAENYSSCCAIMMPIMFIIGINAINEDEN